MTWTAPDGLRYEEVDSNGCGDGGVARFGRTYQSEQNGKEYRYFLLPKRESLILASGYSVPIRAVAKILGIREREFVRRVAFRAWETALYIGEIRERCKEIPE